MPFLDLGSMFGGKKKLKPPIADPSQQGAPNLGALKQGTLDQQQSLYDPLGSFKKRLKQNSPVSMSWMGSALRTGSQPKGIY